MTQSCTIPFLGPWSATAECEIVDDELDADRYGLMGSSGEFCAVARFDPPWYCFWIPTEVMCGGIIPTYEPPSE